MSFEVSSLANKKSAETKHDRIDWVKALESARLSLKFTDINYQSLEAIALASRSPAKFTAISRLIYQYGKSHLNGANITDLILESTNESPFSLSDWIDAIEHFYLWLEKNNRKIDFLTMLEYLQCCVASPDAKEGGQTLSALLEDMLNVHGYDG